MKMLLATVFMASLICLQIPSVVGQVNDVDNGKTAKTNFHKKTIQLQEDNISAKYKKHVISNQLVKSQNHWSFNYNAFENSIPSDRVKKDTLRYSDRISASPEKIEHLKQLLEQEKDSFSSPIQAGNKNYYSSPPPEAIQIDKFRDVSDVFQTGTGTRSITQSSTIAVQSHPVTPNFGVTQDASTQVSEPAVANHGNVVFVTANWFAAKSTNGGTTFSLVDPFAGLPDFCCDQDVIYNSNHNIWIWYRQAISFDINSNQIPSGGRFVISTNDFQTTCSFDIMPTDIDSGLTHHWLDYPHMQATNDKLYFSTNIFDTNPLSMTAYTAMLKFDLANLQNCGQTTFSTYLTSTEFNFTPVSGATNTMYFGTQLFDNIGNPITRVYSWADSGGAPSSADVTYTAYNNMGYSCPENGSVNDPCAFDDTRITGGYVSNGVIGFLWDAGQSLPTFPYPYVNYIRVNQAMGTLIDNPVIYSTNYAVNYPNTGVRQGGDIGIGLFVMGGAQKPAYLVGIHDSASAANGFDFKTVKTSTHNPSINRWGDYVRVKPFKPDGSQWVASGYTLQGGNQDANIENLYTIFSRQQACLPSTSPWDVTTSCTLSSSATAPGDVIVESGVTLTIPSSLSLNIDFANHHLIVKSGGKVLIKSGGKIS